jgi:endo-1,4-beta-xylanase
MTRTQPLRIASLLLLSTLTACGGGGGGGASVPPPASTPNPPLTLPSLPDATTAPPLKSVYASQFLVGAALESQQVVNVTDLALVKKHISSITAANVMKPLTLAPSEGTYNFGPADMLVDFAQENGIEVRGHTLLWHASAPEWFFEGDRTDVQAYRALVKQRLETYITNVVTHFKGKVYAWDVVNEVTGDDPTQPYRHDSPWYLALGPDYIEYAFRAARAADPDVQLFLNEYNTEYEDRRANLLKIVDELVAKNVPIDGVGHQLHLQLGVPMAGVSAALEAIQQRGLINHVTELDVSMYRDPLSCFEAAIACQSDLGSVVTQELIIALSDQARMYRQLYDIFVDYPSLTSVTTWGLSDAQTWLNYYPIDRTNRPLLFDAAGSPKASFWSIADATFLIP